MKLPPEIEKAIAETAGYSHFADAVNEVARLVAEDCAAQVSGLRSRDAIRQRYGLDEPTDEPCSKCWGRGQTMDVHCPYCQSGNAKATGITSKGNHRWECQECGKGFVQNGPLRPCPKCGAKEGVK